MDEMQHKLLIASARQSGYDDAAFDGLDLSDKLDCQCPECINAYAEGQEAALKKIFETRGVVNVA